MARALIGIGRILAEEGSGQGAARIFGVAEALCERSGLAPNAIGTVQQNDPESNSSPGLQARAHDMVLSLWDINRNRQVELRLATPDPALAARLWAMGRTMPLEQAIQEALTVADFWAVKDPATVDPLTLNVNYVGLTKREIEVFSLLCEHWTAPEIAGHLSLSTRTIETHIAHLYNKLGVANRRDALAAGARLGLG